MNATKISRFKLISMSLLVAGSVAGVSAQNDTSSNGRVFGSDAGLVLNFIKPDKTADFEAVVGKVREALQKSEKPERKQQAASWKIFRAKEPGVNGSVLYVFTVDPAVKGADYAVSGILAEAFPAEAQSLYRTYAEAYSSGQNYVNLKLVTALGSEISPVVSQPAAGAPSSSN
jgi:hypothetical protein